MDGQAFDVVAREAAAAVSRRGSLLTLGGAALAASLFGPALAEAKKGGKKSNKKCKKQAGRCRDRLPDLIGAFAQENKVAGYVALLEECCDFLGDCDVARAVQCVTDKASEH
jgi:hypothetical protein